MIVYGNFIVCIFQDDEYAVYNTDRQCIRYLVEFTVHGDLPLTERVISDVATTEIETSSTESKQKGAFLLELLSC